MPSLPLLPARSSQPLPQPVAFPCSRHLPRRPRRCPSTARRGTFPRSSAPPGRRVGKSPGPPIAAEAPRCRWLPVLLATAVVLASSPVPALQTSPPPPEDATFEDVPQTLSGGEAGAKRIQRPKSRQAERCTGKCVGTCIQGGAGSPGEGPFNVRSLVECSDICNLIKDGEDGP